MKRFDIDSPDGTIVIEKSDGGQFVSFQDHQRAIDLVKLRKEEFREAAMEMLDLLIENAPLEGLYAPMVEDWGILLAQY